ncbi:hypothetical protein [Streptomyces sp. NPDC060243]|uniref:hypothetical protein n=1 Tax=Streptomyces sp. NPDC060243 TaxID=3347081 RepID=UPI0036675569
MARAARRGVAGRATRAVRGRRAGALVLGLVCAAGAGPAVAAPEPEPRAGAAWHAWRAAGPERNEELRGVTARGPGDAWAVGYRENAAGVDVPVAEHFDGTAWRATTVPGHAGNGELDAVLARGRADVWAVGSWDDAPARQDRALARHWDGARWREVPLPTEPARRSAYPLALAAGRGGEVWAVGVTAEDRVAAPRPLAYRWDGERWASVPPAGPEGEALLSGLAADGAGGLWAVGVAYGEQGEGRPLAEQWDGAAWRSVPAPHTAGRGEALDGVTALAPDDVWAVGASSPPDGTGTRPLVLHWDGAAWTREEVPDVAGQLHAVTGDGAGGVWAVGEREDATTPAFSLHRDAHGTWRLVPPADGAAGEGASFFDVTRVPGASPGGPALWAVGSTLPRLDPPWRPVVQGYGTRGPGA